QRTLFLHRQVALGLRIFLQTRLELAQWLAGFVHDPQNLERGNDAVACRGEVTENYVTALFAAEIQFLPHHFFNDIAITDFCPYYFAAARRQRFIQTEIAHDRCHDSVLLQPAGFQKIQRRDREDFIAIDNLAVLVAKKNAISITIVTDAYIRVTDLDNPLDLLRVHAATNVVDVD